MLIKNYAVVIFITFFVSLSVEDASAQESEIIVSTNRFVVLDDPNAGTKAPGFFNPTDVRGGSWGTDYWNGESTTIRAAAQVLDANGLPQSGITVTFTLKNPGTTVKNTAISTTDGDGMAYYSFNLNEQKYWGYWAIQANATVSGINIINSSSFALNWWGCAQCHGSENPGNWGTYTPKSYYTKGYSFHKNQDKSKHTEAMSDGTCIICHQMYNGTPVNWRFTDNTPNINPDNEYSPDWHKGKAKCQDCHAGSNTSSTPQGKNPEIAGCYDTAGCHPKKNNNITRINSTTGYVVGGSYRTNYSFIPSNEVKAHNSSSIPCITCHKAGHNITKPYNTTATSNSFTEYQQCTTCHQTYSQHNNNVSCTICHSQDAHAIKVFSKDATYITGVTNMARGNCTNCHQNSTFQDILEAQPGAGSYTGRNPPQIPVPLNHSTDSLSGSLWDGAQPGYWTNTSQLSACYYCHGDTKHNASALGNINTVKGTNIENQNLTGSTWCANCHYGNVPNYAGNLLNPQPPEVLNNSGLVPATSSDSTSFFNHSGVLSSSYDDATCKSCHNNNLSASATSLNFSHNVKIGSSGGPDCIYCHYVGSSYHNIDTVAANASVHFGMNSNNATNAGFAAIDGACWACHDTDGNVTNNPSNQVMGDIYNTPKKCDDCHLVSGIYYAQSVSWGGPTVSEHYYNGSQIKAGNAGSDIASCINCHENVSEMILDNNDPDYGTFAGDGVRLTGGNMSFYHYGKPRSDLRIWDSGNSENCSYCHQNTSTAFAIGMLNPGYNNSIQNHSQTQASPSCYNSTCHNTGWIHNSTLTRPALNPGSAATFCQNCHTTKQAHNGTLDCSNCHINQSSSDTIHPIKFIQNTGTFDTNRVQAANCTNCHQGAGVSGFDGAPKVPEPVNHSTALSAGQKWGNYWDNTSQITACYYCHQNSIHENNTSLFGNVSVIEGSNTLNNPDLANSTWCSNCHYAGAQEYKGNLLAIPPPEITNSSLVASDGTLFFNHSGLSNFNDSNCKNCHGHAISGYSETSLNLSHSVSEGGGDNCVDCHGTNYIGASPSVARTFVNISAFNESIHQNLNMTPPDTVNNLDCWSCHYNKDMNRQDVKKCGDCHRKPSQWHGNANITTNLSELW